MSNLASIDQKRQTGSIRTRLLLWLLIPLIVIGVVALIDAYIDARITADEISDRVLAGSALAIAERVFVNEEGNLEVDIPYVALQMLTSSEDDRVFYRIEDSRGAVVTGYKNLILPTSENSDQAVSFGNSTFRGANIRVVMLKSAASSNTKSLGFVVAVAETTNARQAVAQDLLFRSTVRITSLIGAAALLVWVAVSRSLLPLRRLEEAVARRSPDDVRPIEHKVPNEVNGLVITINDLVLRFANAIQALKNFTSNASHQFRTPLAIIRTHLEIAGREDDPNVMKTAISDAQTAVDDTERMMTQLLTLARIDASSIKELKQSKSDLSQITRKVCEDTVLQLSNRNKSHVDIGYSGTDDLNIYGEANLVQEVIRNLIDNAIKHGGDNLVIDVSVYKSGDRAVLDVYDNGPMFDLPSDEKEANVMSDKGKSLNGFGFAVIYEILNIFDGNITLEKPPTKPGKSISVQFKLADFEKN